MSLLRSDMMPSQSYNNATVLFKLNRRFEINTINPEEKK
jgi:hypothetical protein